METQVRPILASAEVHPNRLRFMYAYTVVMSGTFGLALLVAPNAMLSALGYPTEEPYLAGVTYSVWLAEGILLAFGLRSPVKFAPVLLVQLTYKAIWFVAIIIPHLAAGPLPMFAVTISALFATFVIGDIIAIPWRYIFAK